MMKTNIEIKVEEEVPAGINVVKEIQGDNDDVSKESSSEFSKNKYKYEEGTDEVTGNKEIEPTNTENVVYKTSHFGHELARGSCLLIF